MLLASAVILALGLALLANQSFVLGTITTSSSTAGSSLGSVLNDSATAVYVIGVAVLFVGPGEMLMYFQRSRTGAEYAGDGLLVAARVFFAITVFEAGAYLVNVASAVPPGSVSASSISLPNFIPTVELIIVLVIIGAVLLGVGSTLLSGPRDSEAQVVRSNKYQRISILTGLSADGLYAVGAIFIALTALSLFGGDSGIAPSFMNKADLFGYGMVFLAVGAAVSGVGGMFHAFAYAELPPPATFVGAPVQPSPPTTVSPPSTAGSPAAATPSATPGPSAGAAGKFCMNCGNPLRPGAAFCPSCGTRTKG